MKTIIYILILLLQYSAKSQTIRINPDYIFIGKSKFDSTSLLSDYYKILGTPNRIIYSKNNSSHNNYIFDSIGVAILVNTNKKIVEIRINLIQRKDWDFLPCNIFRGNIFLTKYNYSITENSNYQALGEICIKNKNNSFEFDEEDESSDFKYGAYLISLDHISLNQKTATIYIDFNN
jgi:hypothetical protein